MFDLGLMVLEVAMAITTTWILFRFFRLFLEKKKLNARTIIVLIVFVLFQWAFEHGWGKGSFWIIIANVGLALLLAIIGFTGGWFKKLFLSILLSAFWVLVEISLFFAMSSAHIDIETMGTIGTIASKIVMIICINTAKLFWQKRENGILPKKYCFGLLFIPVGSLYIAFNLYYSSWNNSFALMMTQGLLLVFNVIVFEMYFQLGDRFLAEKEQAIFTQHINSISRNTEEQKRIMHDFREEKHNLVNELIVFKSSLEENGNVSALNSLARIITNLDKSEEISISGNDTVDALINYKYAKAKEMGVRFNLRIFVPNVLPIDQSDLGLLLGNALDNAIEACAECETDTRIVNLKMNVKKEALIIVIENPYKEVKLDKSGNLVTTKENKNNTHGYGLRSIAKVANKYEGEVLTDFGNNEFKLTLILNLLD